MADVVDAATRSRMMASIRGRDTGPEITLRRALFARGYRYTLHSAGLPGRPDLTLAKYRAVVMVNGCFWHGHDCKYFRLPATNTPFWKAKINGNAERDARNIKELRALGWRVMIVWECALRGRAESDIDLLLDQIERWLRTNKSMGEICLAVK